ncbi:MAG: hypothetical protein MJZ13_02295 [Bacteroidales bacterium]|nr:hypothetical protein [Bacteroidales bacterium]
MEVRDIKYLSDFREARKQIKSDIKVSNKKLDLEIEKLKYQMLPTSIIQSAFNKISERLLLWIDTKL